MRLFISWSKDRSRALAEVLRDWVPQVIQEVEPWMSTDGIDKGQQWLGALNEALQGTQGLVCLTPEAQHQPWVMFEAGALMKAAADARIRPVLLDMTDTDVTGPLSTLQSSIATDPDDMMQLVQSINDACDRPLDDDRLRHSFDRLWGEYLPRVEDIPSPDGADQIEARSDSDLLREVLERVRSIEATVSRDPASKQRQDEAVKQLEFSHILRAVKEARRMAIQVAVEDLELGAKVATRSHGVVEVTGIHAELERGEPMIDAVSLETGQEMLVPLTDIIALRRD